MGPDNISEFELTGKKKKDYHHLDKENLGSDRPCDKESIFPTLDTIPGEYACTIHIKYSTEEILKKFNDFIKKRKYRPLKTFENELLLMERTVLARAKRLMACVLPAFRPKLLRFWVTTDEYKSMRVIQIMSLNRSQTEDVRLKYLLQEFAQEALPDPGAKNDIDDEVQDLYSLEATSKYMFSKMLLEQGYSMGQKAKAFLDKIGKHSLAKHLEKHLVRWTEEMKNEMVQDLLKGFNCSRKELTEILPFCRSTIEEFLYSRIFLDEGEVKEVDATSTHFRNTVKQIQKLNYTVSPGQLQREFFWVSAAYETEYPSSGENRETLQELVRRVQPRNIGNKIQILKAYQETLGDSPSLKSTEVVIAATL